MGLRKYKLGDLIKQRREKYDGKDELQSWGVSRDGFIRPKQEDADTSIYNVFYRNDFVFNPARMELNSIALNTSYDKAICSSLYEVFYVTREDVVLPEYLNMFIKRDEFARRCWYEAIGSARNYFRVGDLSQFDITLPSIEQQRKYVDVYLSLQNNLATYQSKVDDLKLVCDGYIEDLRRKMPCEKIGFYIRECNERNEELSISEVQGVESSGNFSETRANTVGLDFHNYKIVRPYQFAYNPSRINLGSIAMRDALSTDCIVSPMYVVFEVVEHGKLLPDYLLLWLTRSEFFRSTLFYASGSVRDTFGFSEMKEVEIPIPDISVQREIVNIHRCYLERQRIAAQLKEQLNNLCPILIKGSLQN